MESIDDGLEHWRTERLSFAAAYRDERVRAVLFLPKNASPPYQSIVYFPGAGAFFQRPPFDVSEIENPWFLFLVRTGRAVLFPVYKGSYERYIGPTQRQDVWRDVVIHAAKDLQRAVDYLEMRPDIDAGRVAFFGVSSGAEVGPIMTAIESRIAGRPRHSNPDPRFLPGAPTSSPCPTPTPRNLPPRPEARSLRLIPS